jgi:hypothetical protein
VISTFAGRGAVPPQLDRGTSLEFPMSVVADPTGAIYFGSANLNSVFKLDASGTVTRVAGNGCRNTEGIRETVGLRPALRCSPSGINFPSPGGLALDSAGNLFIADTGNQ